jgi:hypothetical protein
MRHALGEGRGAENRRKPDEQLSPRKAGTSAGDRGHSGGILEHLDRPHGLRLNSNFYFFFFFSKRAPNNAPPTAAAAGIPKPNNGAGPAQAGSWDLGGHACAHAGAATMTK